MEEQQNGQLAGIAPRKEGAARRRCFVGAKVPTPRRAGRVGERGRSVGGFGGYILRAAEQVGNADGQEASGLCADLPAVAFGL